MTRARRSGLPITLDCITCVIGEIYLVTDVDEVLMKQGDSVVIRGANHAWSIRSGKPALLIGCMIDAIPQAVTAG